MHDGDEITRAAVVARWLTLTQQDLPAAAARHNWAIRLDHCFMRVCLDGAFGQPWRLVIKSPAIRFASTVELQRAVSIAENILRHPGQLAVLNARSLAMRGKGRNRRQVGPNDLATLLAGR